MASVVQKYLTAVRTWGWKELLIKMYSVGEIKFGTLMGVDRNGNKYYENPEYPYGQHRWVEYADIHNYEPTSIPPEWHGWMHHTTDELPQEQSKKPTGRAIVEGGHVPYNLALGKSDYKGEAQINWTAHRSRGYKVGSLNQGPDDPDKYWRQPGHPMHPNTNKGGRFKDIPKAQEAWDPSDPEGENTAQPIRDLDKI